METIKILDSVIEFADKAHGNQKRKYSDERYIVHPVRVMQMVQQYHNEIPMLSAAVLHDVLEDTDVTQEELFKFLTLSMNKEYSERTIELVVELTDVYVKQNFPRMNRRLRKQKEAERLSKVSYEAQTIKYADIFDNTDVTSNDPDFARVYLHEADVLLFHMKAGHPELRDRVINRVKHCLEILKALPSA